MTPVDELIGANLKRLRLKAGMTQEQLGAALSPPVQKGQISKYESGTDRIVSGTLFIFSLQLKAELNEFFAGAEELARAGKTIINLSDSEQRTIVARNIYLKVKNGLNVDIGWNRTST